MHPRNQQTPPFSFRDSRLDPEKIIGNLLLLLPYTVKLLVNYISGHFFHAVHSP